MTPRKLLVILLGLFVILLVAVIISSNKHPIILKVIAGSARSVGKPIKMNVYTDGRLRQDIEVYHVDEGWDGKPADSYLIHFVDADFETTNIISINKKYHNVGRPSATYIKEYDKILGRLFQGEVGGTFTSFTDDMKGYDFDPHLSITDQRITLKLPRRFECDSMLIELLNEGVKK